MSTPDTENLDAQSDGIDLHTAVDQIIFPPVVSESGRLRTSYLLKTAKFLQENPGESYSVRGIHSNILEGTHIDGDSFGMLATDWFRQYIGPHLHWLPGIVLEGGAWQYDPAALERPEIPDQVTYPPEDQVKERINQIDLPNRSQKQSWQNSCTVRDLYFDLQERGTATREELWQHYDPNVRTDPNADHYASPSEWWAAVGRNALEKLPGIDQPVMPAGEWRYIGVQQ
jgi:hypothetical protein